MKVKDLIAALQALSPVQKEFDVCTGPEDTEYSANAIEVVDAVRFDPITRSPVKCQWVTIW